MCGCKSLIGEKGDRYCHWLHIEESFTTSMLFGPVSDRVKSSSSKNMSRAERNLNSNVQHGHTRVTYTKHLELTGTGIVKSLLPL